MHMHMTHITQKQHQYQQYRESNTSNSLLFIIIVLIIIISIITIISIFLRNFTSTLSSWINRQLPTQSSHIYLFNIQHTYETLFTKNREIACISDTSLLLFLTFMFMVGFLPHSLLSSSPPLHFHSQVKLYISLLLLQYNTSHLLSFISSFPNLTKNKPKQKKSAFSITNKASVHIIYFLSPVVSPFSLSLFYFS